MPKFRKRPVVIEAIRVADEEEIQTLEGTMRASPGDWIITGVAGERYPCKPDIFKKTYEPLETDSAPEVFENPMAWLTAEAAKVWQEYEQALERLCIQSKTVLLPIAERFRAAKSSADHERLMADIGPELYRSPTFIALMQHLLSDPANKLPSELPAAVHLVGKHTLAGNLHVAEGSESYTWHMNTCPSCTTGQTVPVLSDDLERIQEACTEADPSPKPGGSR